MASSNSLDRLASQPYPGVLIAAVKHNPRRISKLLEPRIRNVAAPASGCCIALFSGAINFQTAVIASAGKTMREATRSLSTSMPDQDPVASARRMAPGGVAQEGLLQGH